jgi:hypothetical protein
MPSVVIINIAVIITIFLINFGISYFLQFINL